MRTERFARRAPEAGHQGGDGGAPEKREGSPRKAGYKERRAASDARRPTTTRGSGRAGSKKYMQGIKTSFICHALLFAIFAVPYAVISVLKALIE